MNFVDPFNFKKYIKRIGDSFNAKIGHINEIKEDIEYIYKYRLDKTYFDTPTAGQYLKRITFSDLNVPNGYYVNINFSQVMAVVNLENENFVGAASINIGLVDDVTNNGVGPSYSISLTSATINNKTIIYRINGPTGFTYTNKFKIGISYLHQPQLTQNSYVDIYIRYRIVKID